MLRHVTIVAPVIVTMLSFTLNAYAECTAAGNSPGNSLRMAIAGNRVHTSSCTPEAPPRMFSPARAKAPSLEPLRQPEDHRWLLAREMGVNAPYDYSHGRSAELDSPVARSISQLQWADSNDWIHNPPAWMREAVNDAHNYKKRGMPIVHLWASPHGVLAIGVNSHGTPGLYFSQRLPF
jgi:hypothetical protein